jgi:hypothetical protein
MQNIINEILSYSVPEYSAFMVYLSKHNKSYGDLTTFESRLKIFINRTEEIRLLNKQL